MRMTLLGIITLVRLVQNWNAQSPMLMTLLGIVTLVRRMQAEKANPPMLVTLLGIVTLVRLDAGRERIAPDAGDAVGDRDVGQVGAG